MKRFFVMALATMFSMTCVATPGAPSGIGWVIEGQKQLKLGVRSMKLRDLYLPMRQGLEAPQRRLMDELLARYPEAIVPKFEIKRIKKTDGNEEYRLVSNERGQSLTVRLYKNNLGEAVAEMTTSVMRKPLKIVIGENVDLRQSVYDFDQFAQGLKAPFPNHRNFEMMDYQSLVKLSRSDRQKYYNSLQKVLAAMERVQRMKEKNDRSTAQKEPSFFSLFFQSAIASGGDESCVVAGHITKYANGVCGKESAEISWSGNKIQCNPQIYGDNQVFVDPAQGAAACNQ